VIWGLVTGEASVETGEKLELDAWLLNSDESCKVRWNFDGDSAWMSDEGGPRVREDIDVAVKTACSEFERQGLPVSISAAA